MWAVNIGVGHQHYLVITQLGDVEFVVNPVPKAVMIDWTSVFFNTRSMRAFSTLMILPRNGRIAWNIESRPLWQSPG